MTLNSILEVPESTMNRSSVGFKLFRLDNMSDHTRTVLVTRSLVIRLVSSSNYELYGTCTERLLQARVSRAITMLSRRSSIVARDWRRFSVACGDVWSRVKDEFHVRNGKVVVSNSAEWARGCQAIAMNSFSKRVAFHTVDLDPNYPPVHAANPGVI